MSRVFFFAMHHEALMTWIKSMAFYSKGGQTCLPKSKSISLLRSSAQIKRAVLFVLERNSIQIKNGPLKMLYELLTLQD